MLTDLDIFRTANILVRQHGEDAPVEALGWAPTLGFCPVFG